MGEFEEIWHPREFDEGYRTSGGIPGGRIALQPPGSWARKGAPSMEITLARRFYPWGYPGATGSLTRAISRRAPSEFPWNYGIVVGAIGLDMCVNIRPDKIY